jgi:hypothetical protein
LATPPSAGRIQLCPTASSFTPAGLTINGFGMTEHSAYSINPAVSGVSHLTADSEPDIHDAGDAYGKHSSQSPSGFGPIGKYKMTTSPLPMMYVHIGQFDSGNRNRAFAIEGIPTGLAYLSLAGLFDVSIP